MAFRCDNCQYIYHQKRTSCPFCGGRVYNDSNLGESLLKDGFIWAPGQSQSSGTDAVPIQSKPASGNDPFESLRQDFFKEHENPSTAKRENSSTAVSSSSAEADIPSTNEQPAVDFFSSLGTASSSDNSIPTVNPQIDSKQPSILPSESPNSYEQELQELERQRQLEERRYRRREAINFFANIQWRTVFRIFLIIAVLLAAITLYKMRHVIINSILDFIFALVPIAIVLWIVYSLLRSLFR